MEIREITPAEYREFLHRHHIGYNFMQSAEYASFKDRFILGGEEDGKLTHAVIVQPKPAMKVFRYGYTAQDFASASRKTARDFLRSAARYLKDRKKYILWQMEASVEDREYDSDGQPVSGGFDNSGFIRMMEDCGFSHQDLGAGTNTAHQCTWNSVIVLKPEIRSGGYVPANDRAVQPVSYEELLMRMKGSTRRAVKSGARKGVTVTKRKPSEMTARDWQEFEDLVQKAGTTHGFDAGDLAKHQAFAEAFGDTCTIATAYVEGTIPAAAGMVIETPHEMIYYSSGTDRAYGKYNGATVLQGAMLEQAVDHGLARYHFGGISGYFEPDQEGYGVYKFKKELGGTVIHTAGVFNLPLNAMGRRFEKRLV